MEVDFKMDPAMKSRWIAALRSGEFKQGRERLCTLGDDYEAPDKFCCLGVLNKIEELGYPAGNGWLCKETYVPGVGLLAGDYGVLPESVQVTLSVMNDNDWASFEQIANWIEVNL